MSLPEDDEHPVRPDLPVLRHLTFTEVHAIELGIYVALFVLFLQIGGFTGEAVMVLLAVFRTVSSDQKARGEGTRCDHRLGFHDARAELPYFGFGAVATYVVGYAVAYLLHISVGMPG